MERHKVFRTARIYLALLALVAVSLSLCTAGLPAMLVGLTTLYGGWLTIVFGVTQHAGLSEDVLDHRLNSRTIYMNPIFRFLYWNMNYHVEHHMFPMVPYHALPKLHEAVKDDCPTPYRSLFAAWCEIVPQFSSRSRTPHITSNGVSPRERPVPARMRTARWPLRTRTAGYRCASQRPWDAPTSCASTMERRLSPCTVTKRASCMPPMVSAPTETSISRTDL